MEDLARVDPPSDGPPSSLPAPPELAALAAIEQAFARMEGELRRMRDEDAALLTFAYQGPVPEPQADPLLAATPDAASSSVSTAQHPADRLVALVARLSLDAQERVEAALARRRSAERPGPPGPAGPSLTERVRIPLASARDAAARIGAQARALGATLGPRLAASRPLRVTATVAVAGLLAVQVLGIGRPSQGVPAASDAGPVAAAPDTATPTEPVAPTPPPTSSGADVTERPATVDIAPAPQRIAAPVSLRVPAIEVDAPVVVVGLEPDRSMEIPSDVRTVGWYDPFAGAGVAPGEPGTAVIAGHVDSRTQGRGAFWPLRELVPGDVIDVEHADGTVSRWRVESVVRHPKTDIPIEDIFTFEGEERLALITCGGEFDRSAGAYLDNYVVTAVPLRTAIGGPAQALPTAP